MATNQYFNSFKSRPDQNLHEKLIIESIKIAGVDVYYIPRTTVNKSELFGEDPLSRFDDALIIEMYIKSFDGAQGQSEFLSKFGLQIQDSITLSVSKRRFEEVVSLQDSTITRPREGDLIKIPHLANGLYEIKFVEDEVPYFQLGNRATYDIRAELFRYSSEPIDTGIDEIDEIATENENDNSVENVPFAKNDDIEDLADGPNTADDSDDSGIVDRNTGIVDFNETNPFGNY